MPGFAPQVTGFRRGPVQIKPGGNPGANLRSISHRCYLREVVFEWELKKETIYLPQSCLQGSKGLKKAIRSYFEGWREDEAAREEGASIAAGNSIMSLSSLSLAHTHTHTRPLSLTHTITLSLAHTHSLSLSHTFLSRTHPLSHFEGWRVDEAAREAGALRAAGNSTLPPEPRPHPEPCCRL